MARTVTTVLTLKDRMSDKFATIRKNSDNTAKSVQRKFTLMGQKFSAVGKKINKVGQKVTGVGKGLTAGVTAPIVAAGAASISAWKEIDEGMDIVIAKTGATGDALKDLRENVENVATSVPTSFAEAGVAIGEVNTRFGLVGDELESLSSQFIQFSQLNDVDLTSTIDSTQAAMSAFNVETSQAGVFLDTVNKVAQDTGTNAVMLTDNMKKNSSTLKELGFSASDAAFFIANLDKSGIDTGSTLQGMKKGLTEATAEGKSMSEAMSELQDRIANAPSQTEAYAASIEMFGGRSGAAIADAVREGRLSFDDMGTSMSDFSGNVEQAFNDTNDPLNNFQTTLNKIKTIGADIANSALPLVADVMERIADVVDKLKEKWSGLSDKQQELILKIAGIAAVVGPVLVVIGTVISVIGTIVGAIGTVISVIGTIIGAIGTAINVITFIGGIITGLAAGPILLIVGAVAAVIAIVIIFRDRIKEAVLAVAGAIADFATRAKAKFDEFKENVAQAVENVKQKFEEFKQKVAEIWAGIGDAIKSGIQGALDWITSKIDGIKQKFNDVKSAISNLNPFGGKDGKNATGTQYWTGGRTWVGENGPELVDLPSGSKVYPHTKSTNMASSPAPVVNITIQGNLIGNSEYADMIGNRVCSALMVAMAN